ncbi:MAG: hypothetical protein VX899_01330 [Myxococcota bacterium]|nr:hypothetical protein [Myxococcota bacterium]
MRDLDAAISAAVPAPDERGLMPLEQARALVEAAEVYREGMAIRLADGRPATEGARLWAALLSLEDADEFVAHATRIRWLEDVPGPNNTAPLFRYGDDILPWLARFVSPRGWLQNLPNCVGACLMASPTEAAFHLLTPVRGIHHAPEHPAESPPELAAPGLMDWTARYPRTGLALLVRGARQGDRRLHALLRDLVSRAPGASFQMLSTRFGAQQTQRWFEELELPSDRPSPQLQALVRQAPLSHVPYGPPLTLPTLNRAFREGIRPFWDHAGFFTAAIRVSGFAHASGDALIFESLVTGLVDDGVRVEIHGYGPHFGPRQARYCFEQGRELLSDAALSTADGDRLELHSTGVVLQWDGGWQLQHTPWDHPRRSAEISLDGELLDLPLRLPPELEGHLGPSEALMWNLPPERAFLSPGALLARLELPPDAERLFVFDSFQMPFGEHDAAQSQDLIAMVEALGQRRKLQRLPQGRGRLFHVQDRIQLRGGWGTVAGWGPRSD